MSPFCVGTRKECAEWAIQLSPESSDQQTYGKGPADAINLYQIELRNAIPAMQHRH
jgi:hypothetical protein